MVGQHDHLIEESRLALGLAVLIGNGHRLCLARDIRNGHRQPVSDRPRLV